MDLSTIEGLELSEDQQKAILSLHESETKGLRDNRDLLLTEKQEAKRVAEEAQAKAEAEAQKLALAEAKKAGDLKGLESTLTEQFTAQIEAANSKASKFEEMLLGGKRDTLVAEIAQQFVSPDAAKMILSQMIDVSAGDDGTITTFKDGDGKVVTMDKKVFAEWLKGQDAFKPLMRGVDSAGGGANGSGSGSSGAATSQGDWRSRKIAEINEKFKS